MKANDLPKKTFTPTGSKVAIKVNKQTRTLGGVELPENVQGGVESVTGWIVATGPDCKQMKRGDLVISYLDTPGVAVTYKGQRLVVLEEDTICGVIDPEES